MGVLGWFTKNAGKKLNSAANLLSRAQTKRNSFNTAKELTTAKETDERVAQLRKIYDDAQKALKDLQSTQGTDLARAKRDVNDAYMNWKASTVSLTDRLKQVTKMGFTKALFGNNSTMRTSIVQAQNAKLNKRLEQREKEAETASAEYKQQLADEAEAEKKRKEEEEKAAKLREEAIVKRESILKTLAGTASKQVTAVSSAPLVPVQRNKANLNVVNASALFKNKNKVSDPVAPAHNLDGGSRRAPRRRAPRRRGTHRRR